MPALPLSQEQLEDAARLKKRFQEWQRHQREAGIPSSQEIVSDQVGVNQSALSQYLNARIPLNLQFLLTICKIIGADPREVSPRLTRIVEQTTQVMDGRVPFDENVIPARPSLRPIPVISSVQAGALRDMETPYPLGSGYAVEYTDDDKLSRWAFGLDVEGQSMMPMFQPGDRIIVDPELAPNPGDFVVARNGSDQATFKKYRPRGIDHNGEMIFELVPLNDDYPTLRSDTEHLIVIGVVTEFKKKLRRT